jgi:hypothetical protein
MVLQVGHITILRSAAVKRGLFGMGCDWHWFWF